MPAFVMKLSSMCLHVSLAQEMTGISRCVTLWYAAAGRWVYVVASKSLIFMCIPNLVMLVLLCVGVIIVPLYRHSQPEHIPIDDLAI